MQINRLMTFNWLKDKRKRTLSCTKWQTVGQSLLVLLGHALLYNNDVTDFSANENALRSWLIVMHRSESNWKFSKKAWPNIWLTVWIYFKTIRCTNTAWIHFYLAYVQAVCSQRSQRQYTETAEFWTKYDVRCWACWAKHWPLSAAESVCHATNNNKLNKLKWARIEIVIRNNWIKLNVLLYCKWTC